MPLPNLKKLQKYFRQTPDYGVILRFVICKKENIPKLLRNLKRLKNWGLKNDPVFYSNWAEALSAKSEPEFEEAEIKIKKAYRLDNKSPIVLETWGNIFYDQAKYLKVIKKFEEVLTIDSTIHTALHNYALCYYNLQNFQSAEEFSQKAKIVSIFKSDEFSQHTE